MAEKVKCLFIRVFSIIDKIFILGLRLTLGFDCMKLSDFLDIS